MISKEPLGISLLSKLRCDRGRVGATQLFSRAHERRTARASSSNTRPPRPLGELNLQAGTSSAVSPHIKIVVSPPVNEATQGSAPSSPSAWCSDYLNSRMETQTHWLSAEACQSVSFDWTGECHNNPSRPNVRSLCRTSVPIQTRVPVASEAYCKSGYFRRKDSAASSSTGMPFRGFRRS